MTNNEKEVSIDMLKIAIDPENDNQDRNMAIHTLQDIDYFKNQKLEYTSDTSLNVLKNFLSKLEQANPETVSK